MEVWIVSKESYTETGGNFKILGVFSTRAKAYEFLSKSSFDVRDTLDINRAILDSGVIYGICGTEWNA
ncbi:hypothetical protein HOS50_gp091 [Lactobacillus phage Lenus]|uniref:DUF7336 domain-containing protein n=1 Tax=Lactobacillus phage Lenus TaxID=2053682 RepID=A0A2H4PBD3_9CAUD|nr:hypothetical protein HOS50_gp091 [Lactobacillus phage Lenus]ATW59541.1 hypothetical protein [Lactobacillus phage Lenus]